MQLETTHNGTSLIRHFLMFLTSATVQGAICWKQMSWHGAAASFLLPVYSSWFQVQKKKNQINCYYDLFTTNRAVRLFPWLCPALCGAPDIPARKSNPITITNYCYCEANNKMEKKNFFLFFFLLPTILFTRNYDILSYKVNIINVERKKETEAHIEILNTFKK